MSARIVLIEQDRLFKDLLIPALKSETCEVLDANSVAEAKTIIVDQGLDLVIVNANLPGAIPFILELQAAKSPLIALVDSDHLRDLLRLAQISVVDRRGSLAALSDAIRSAICFEVQLGTGSAHHVLVVDDEEEVRGLLSEFLTQRGYTTSMARDGIEAMQAIDREPGIAVVILDVTMPRQGGVQTLAEIMKRQSHPDVIMLTALADRQIAQQALKLGAFQYILKPPDLNEVEATVSACIALSEMRHGNGPHRG